MKRSSVDGNTRCSRYLQKNRSNIILKTENFARFTSEHTTAKPPRGCNMITTVGPLWTSVQEQCPDPWPRSPPTPASSASPLKDASLAPSNRNVMANVKTCVDQTSLLWLFTPPLHTVTKSGRDTHGISRLTYIASILLIKHFSHDCW